MGPQNIRAAGEGEKAGGEGGGMGETVSLDMDDCGCVVNFLLLYCYYG